MVLRPSAHSNAHRQGAWQFRDRPRACDRLLQAGSALALLARTAVSVGALLAHASRKSKNLPALLSVAGPKVGDGWARSYPGLGAVRQLIDRRDSAILATSSSRATHAASCTALSRGGTGGGRAIAVKLLKMVKPAERLGRIAVNDA